MAIGQAQVEQHDVPAPSRAERERFRGCSGLAELYAVRQALENLDDAAPHQGVVVDDEDADHAGLRDERDGDGN